MLRWFRSLLQKEVVLTSFLLALALGARQLGWLEALELYAYDQTTRLFRNEDVDPRLLIVSITEQDLQALNQSQVPDNQLLQALRRIEAFQPRLIAIDMFRDLPIPDLSQSSGAYPELLQYLRDHAHVVSVCDLGTMGRTQGVGPPAGLSPEQVGFADVVIDEDGILRRNLVSVTPDPQSLCQAPYSLSYLLALRYLNDQGVTQAELNRTLGPPLQSSSGPYDHIDASGFQLLLRFRREPVAEEVTFSQVLDNQIRPAQIRDRIVLIGVTTFTGKDLFRTPFTVGSQSTQLIPGVIVHAQMLSQLLDIGLGQAPPLWTWPEGGELIWVVGWGIGSTLLLTRFRSPLHLVLAGVATWKGLLVVYLLLFWQSGWVPVAAPSVMVLVAALGPLLYRDRNLAPIQTPGGPVPATQSTDGVATHVLNGELSRADLLQTVESYAFSSVTKSGSSSASDSPWILANRYQILNKLGQGGQGRTYRAIDLLQPGHPFCVVKQLLITQRHDSEARAVARRCFKREAEILQMLGDHEQIPRLLAYFEEDGEFYLVQEYVEGWSLESEMENQNRWPCSEVILMMQDILQVLAFVHQHQIIHRDLKPSNVLRRAQDRRLVLIDFGTVKRLEITGASTISIGTLGYTPLEQWEGRPVLASDLYAVGIMGLHALTGCSLRQLNPLLEEQFFRDPTVSASSWHSRWQAYLPASCSESLRWFFQKMVAINFSERFISAGEALQALEQVKPTFRDESTPRAMDSTE